MGDYSYKMNYKHRGIAVIIVNKSFSPRLADCRKLERRGAEKDVVRMRKLFKRLGFQVRDYEDLTRDEMKDKLRKGDFYAPGLNGLPGVNQGLDCLHVFLSVCLSACMFVCLCTISFHLHYIYTVQYLKFRCWYSYQTWTISSPQGFLHFTNITYPWEGDVKM